jgi:hypothetical protein
MVVRPKPIEPPLDAQPDDAIAALGDGAVEPVANAIEVEHGIRARDFRSRRRTRGPR